MSKQKVVVIGAGVGGLVAALELSAKGFDVTVVERAAAPGGKLRQLDVGGALIDSGPTVMTMRWVFDELFDALGTRVEDHFTLQRARRIARHAWEADEHLDLFDDLQESAEAVGRFAGADEARRFLAFSEEARVIYQACDVPFIRSGQAGVLGLMQRTGLAGLADLWRIRPYSTVWRALGDHFRDPRLRQLFGRYAGYCGASPFLAPATLMLVAHVEREGVWLVQGGMYSIIKALTGMAAARGADFRLATEVRTILVQGGRAAGVELATGERLSADAVVMNGDVSAVGMGLLGADARSAVPPVRLAQRSMSAVTWSLLAKTTGFPLIRHNVFFSGDYAAEFDDIFKRRCVPAAPTVYVCAQDRDDQDESAPSAAERLLLIVNAPANGDQHALTETEIEACAKRTFGHLEDCGLKVAWADGHSRLTTPTEFDRLFPGTGGALYGRASHGWRSAFQRPGARSKLPGLYLAGGSTHPGPGVPMAALSGRQAAASLLEDHASIRR